MQKGINEEATNICFEIRIPDKTPRIHFEFFPQKFPKSDARKNGNEFDKLVS